MKNFEGYKVIRRVRLSDAKFHSLLRVRSIYRLRRNLLFESSDDMSGNWVLCGKGTMFVFLYDLFNPPFMVCRSTFHSFFKSSKSLLSLWILRLVIHSSGPSVFSLWPVYRSPESKSLGVHYLLYRDPTIFQSSILILRDLFWFWELSDPVLLSIRMVSNLSYRYNFILELIEIFCKFWINRNVVYSR